MNILLLNPPFLKNFSRPQRSPAVTKSGTLYFPLWLAYAAGVLEKEGHTVDLIDAPADSYDLDYVIERAEALDPGLIVLDTSTPSIYNDADIAGKLKDKFPKSFVTLVGTHVSALPEESLNIDRRVDAVARYEYDYTLADLAKTISKNPVAPGFIPSQSAGNEHRFIPGQTSGGQAPALLAKTLTGKGDLKNVAGLVFRNDGQIIHTPRREFIKDLDDLPFVSQIYKKFLHIERYFNPNALYPMVTISTSRGCVFPCTFCVYPQTLMGRNFRLRSIGNVISEMEYIVENFPQAKAIFFEDDTLTVNKNRCQELAERIIQRKIKISWTANARVSLDYETMQAMQRAGCRSLCVGFESGSQQILDNMKKKITLAEMEKFMSNARRAGILIHGCFMAGLPGETRETLQETLNLAKKIRPDTVQFYPVMVYPGTEAYNWYKERGLIQTADFAKWITHDGLHNTVIRTESLSSEDLVRFCDNARREFYLRPSYLFYKMGQMITHPQEIRRTLKSLRTFTKYLIRGSDIETGNS